MISIIIPTYNESDVIAECLRSLDRQSIKNFEVIVVDDGSTDITLRVVSELKIESYKLKIVHGAHSGAGAARNFGAKNATGEILVFVDADMTFEKNFIKNLTKPILNAKARGTFSKDEYVSNWENIWARCWNINEGWQPRRRHPKKFPNHQSVFRAILKSEFEKVGGFTPGGYDDDWSLSKKLGYEAIDSEQLSFSKAIFYHKNPSSLGEVFKHAKWIGKRKYKLGFFGYLIALTRSSLPISLILGSLYALRHMLFSYIVFKIVYDFGIFIGIIEYLLYRKVAK